MRGKHTLELLMCESAIAIFGAMLIASTLTIAAAADEPNPKKPSTKLEDGVYPVLQHDDQVPPGHKVVELVIVPVAGSEPATPAAIRVTDQPLIRFKSISHFNFRFEANECTEISFQNTNELKAFTREHPGSRLAVVVDNKVISHHKVREPLTSSLVRITCCTVGGGDHLCQHLKKLKLATESKSDP